VFKDDVITMPITGNMHSQNVAEVWQCDFQDMQGDRQTDKQINSLQYFALLLGVK